MRPHSALGCCKPWQQSRRRRDLVTAGDSGPVAADLARGDGAFPQQIASIRVVPKPGTCHPHGSGGIFGVGFSATPSREFSSARVRFLFTDAYQFHQLPKNSVVLDGQLDSLCITHIDMHLIQHGFTGGVQVQISQPIVCRTAGRSVGSIVIYRFDSGHEPEPGLGFEVFAANP